MFIVNCQQELVAYNFWTIKDLIKAEAVENPGGLIGEKTKQNKNKNISSPFSNLAFKVFGFKTKMSRGGLN